MSTRRLSNATPQGDAAAGAAVASPATGATTPATGAGTVVVNLPPVPGAPQRPADFTPMTLVQTRLLLKPGVIQEANANGVAGELRSLEIAGTYTPTFGTTVPTAKELVTALTTAAAWSVEYTRAKAWLAYAQHQRLTGWHRALTLMAQFKPVFEAVAPRMPALAEALSAVVSFVSTGKARGVRAAATRKATATASTAKVQHAATRAQKKADKVQARAAAAQHAADAAKFAADQQRAAAQAAAQAAALAAVPTPATSPTPPPTH